MIHNIAFKILVLFPSITKSRLFKCQQRIHFQRYKTEPLNEDASNILKMWLYSLKKGNMITLFFDFKHVTIRMGNETGLVAPKLSNKANQKKKKKQENTTKYLQPKSSH